MSGIDPSESVTPSPSARVYRRLGTCQHRAFPGNLTASTRLSGWLNSPSLIDSVEKKATLLGYSFDCMEALCRQRS
jgi:hypothetical protein